MHGVLSEALAEPVTQAAVCATLHVPLSFCCERPADIVQCGAAGHGSQKRHDLIFQGHVVWDVFECVSRAGRVDIFAFRVLLL